MLRIRDLIDVPDFFSFFSDFNTYFNKDSIENM